MFGMIVDMKVDIEMLKTAFGNSIKVGAVEEIDANKGFRIKLGEGPDGEPFLSPWRPHPESGGQSLSWMPLSKGQIVGIVNPTGDMRQGLIFRGGFSGEHQQPSDDLLANVLKAFGITITMRDGVLTIDGNVRINGRLHTTAGIHDNGGVFSTRGVWPPKAVYVPPVGGE